MLHPRFADPATTAALAAAFTGTVRIPDILAPDFAVALRDALRACPHQLLLSQTPELAFQYWVFTQAPDDDCDHVVCRAARCLFTDLTALLSTVTGIPLAPPADRQLVSTLYDKGSYLDPHNDWNGARKVAYVLGLTESPLDPADGGWLEFFPPAPPERRPPGWNTLDVFDVRAPDRPHAVPILTRHAERRALSGWFY